MQKKNTIITLNDIINLLNRFTFFVNKNSEVILHDDNIIECGKYILDINKQNIENTSYCCYKCQNDKRLLSKDKTHRLCNLVCTEVTINECKKLKDKN